MLVIKTALGYCGLGAGLSTHHHMNLTATQQISTIILPYFI